MKKSLSYKEYQKFDTAATAYLVKEGYFINAIPARDEIPAIPGRFTEKAVTKLVANIKSVIKQGDKHFEGFTELQTDIYIDHCAVDTKTNVMLLNPKGGYQFTKEKQKEVNKKLKELLNSEIEINVRITEGELSLTDEEKEAFNGIVIPEFKEELEAE